MMDSRWPIRASSRTPGFNTTHNSPASAPCIPELQGEGGLGSPLKQQHTCPHTSLMTAGSLSGDSIWGALGLQLSGSSHPPLPVKVVSRESAAILSSSWLFLRAVAPHFFPRSFHLQGTLMVFSTMTLQIAQRLGFDLVHVFHVGLTYSMGVRMSSHSLGSGKSELQALAPFLIHNTPYLQSNYSVALHFISHSLLNYDTALTAL